MDNSLRSFTFHSRGIPLKKRLLFEKNKQVKREGISRELKCMHVIKRGCAAFLN